MSLILTQSNSAPGSNPASYVNRFKNTFEEFAALMFQASYEDSLSLEP